MKINLKKTIQFKNLSKDLNLIHFDKNFSSKYYFKEPIVHGVNVCLAALSGYLKNKNIQITSIKINFLNFILINEEFFFKFNRNKIIVYNNINKKIEIDLKIRRVQNSQEKIISKKIINYFNFKKNYNNNLIKELLFISKFIGSTKPGNGSLIQTIKINYNEKNNLRKKILTKRIVNQIFNISYSHKNFNINVVASKLAPFNLKNKKTMISSKVLQNIRNKKILIFGPTSDLSKRLLLPKIKKNCEIHSYSFRVSNNQINLKKKDFIPMKKLLLSLKPDYIFYFSSPKILSNNKFSRALYSRYKLVYVDYFNELLKIVKNHLKKTKIFYPSTIYLEKSQKNKKGVFNYIKAKKLGEKICKLYGYKSIVKVYRLPQYQSRSNYNILGFYEGKKIFTFDNYLNHFFKEN